MGEKAVVMLGLGLVAGLSVAPPALAQVSVNINLGPPPIVVAPPPPEIVVVPGAPVYFYGGQYFRYHDGAWFVAARHEGPWGYVAVGLVPPPVLALPGAYERMPARHVRDVGPPPWARHERDHERDGDHERGHEHQRRDRD
jgi:hypothetical protein